MMKGKNNNNRVAVLSKNKHILENGLRVFSLSEIPKHTFIVIYEMIFFETDFRFSR
jgi:hypothetical protein